MEYVLSTFLRSCVVSVYSSRARAIYSVPRKSTTNPPTHSILVQHAPLNPSQTPNHPSYPSTPFNTLKPPSSRSKPSSPVLYPLNRIRLSRVHAWHRLPQQSLTVRRLSSTVSWSPHRSFVVLDCPPFPSLVLLYPAYGLTASIPASLLSCRRRAPLPTCLAHRQPL